MLLLERIYQRLPKPLCVPSLVTLQAQVCYVVLHCSQYYAKRLAWKNVSYFMSSVV